MLGNPFVKTQETSMLLKHRTWETIVLKMVLCLFLEGPGWVMKNSLTVEYHLLTLNF